MINEFSKTLLYSGAEIFHSYFFISLLFQIDIYEQLYEEVRKIETRKILYEWLRIDINPFKQALLNTVCKWSNMLKQHLVDHVINRYVYI